MTRWYWYRGLIGRLLHGCPLCGTRTGQHPECGRRVDDVVQRVVYGR